MKAQPAAQTAAPPSRIRVLHLFKTSDWAVWGLRQVDQLVQLGVDVHVALPPGGRLIPAYEAAGACVHLLQQDLPPAAPWRARATLRSIRSLVDRVAPDLIHSHFVGSTLAARLALGKRHEVPRIFQVPGPFHLEHPLTRRVELATAGEADWWIGSCRWTVERYRRSQVPAERVFLSYYGTDTDHYRRRSPGALRRELGLGPTTPVVGMLAFVYPPKRYLGYRRGVKGHEDLIDALALCLRHEPQMRCVFVGGAWKGAEAYAQRIREHAQRRCGEAAVFLGSRGDVPELIADVDVMAIPSLSENVGAAVESLLAEIPTVATTVGGLPDLVEDPATGWLVPPRDPEQLAAAILAALADRREAAARAARGAERARHMFDVRRTAREVLAIYQDVISQRKNLTA